MITGHHFTKARRFEMLRSRLLLRSFCSASETASVYSPSLSEIKHLRYTSEAPIKDCKKALVEANGALPAALEWLRKKGIASASAKSGRSTLEGLVGMCLDGHVGSVVEINSETDFVARHEHFQDLVRNIALSLTNNNENISKTQMDKKELLNVRVGTSLVFDLIPSLIGKMGENLAPRRGTTLSVNQGSVIGYVHNEVGENVGRTASLIALEHEPVSKEVHEAIQSMGKKLAMHIVAAKPRYLDQSQVPQEVVDKEKAFLMEEASGSGKPLAIVEKMVLGRMNKFYGEVCLVNQPHLILAENPKVSTVLVQFNNKHKVEVKVASYVRYHVGEDDDHKEE